MIGQMRPVRMIGRSAFRTSNARGAYRQDRAATRENLRSVQHSARRAYGRHGSCRERGLRRIERRTDGSPLPRLRQFWAVQGLPRPRDAVPRCRAKTFVNSPRKTACNPFSLPGTSKRFPSPAHSISGVFRIACRKEWPIWSLDNRFGCHSRIPKNSPSYRMSASTCRHKGFRKKKFATCGASKVRSPSFPPTKSDSWNRSRTNPWYTRTKCSKYSFHNPFSKDTRNGGIQRGYPTGVRKSRCTRISPHLPFVNRIVTGEKLSPKKWIAMKALRSFFRMTHTSNPFGNGIPYRHKNHQEKQLRLKRLIGSLPPNRSRPKNATQSRFPCFREKFELSFEVASFSNIISDEYVVSSTRKTRSVRVTSILSMRTRSPNGSRRYMPTVVHHTRISRPFRA